MRRADLFAVAIAAAVMAAAAAGAWNLATPVVEPSVPVEETDWPSGERLVLSRNQIADAVASGAVDRPVKSLLSLSRPMRHGDFHWNDRLVPQGKVWLRVDLDSQIISIFRAGHEIGTAVILFGAESNKTPTGLFPIQTKIRDHHSSTYDAPMPFTLRLTEDGVAVHGSDVRWGRATHGCVGVPVEFARRLFDEVTQGDEVLILGRSGTARRTQASQIVTS